MCLRYIVNEFQRRKLNNLQDAPLFTLSGVKTNAKIVHVYDGDTVHGVILLNNKPKKFKIRMLGYDSPEMKPPLKQENREEEKRAAIEAKNAISNLILNKVVGIHFFEFDKYGRPLAEIYVDRVKVNDWMMENGHGYPYDGKTKSKFVSKV